MTRPTLKTARSTARADNGFILVTVLWLIAALAGLASIYSVYSVNSAVASRLSDDRLQAEAAVRAGVELAAYQAISALAAARPARGAFVTKLARETISVRYRSEAARIDLNAAPKELLSGLLTVLGAGDDAAKQAADRIVGWRTKAATDGDAAKEAALYQTAGRTYSPRQAPFAHVNELALVLGLTPALVERALPYVTVFSGAAGVDVMVAPPEVIAALPGMTPLKLKQFLGDRGSLVNDAAALSAALGGANGAN
ncbi:MAG TPA: type II secretion system minor pseudopilin GspK, partial [Roseiarcus sp.]|nr:type II secretion system minor pseudopilin GspK [Roseiarcus sp.]